MPFGMFPAFLSAHLSCISFISFSLLVATLSLPLNLIPPCSNVNASSDYSLYPEQFLSYRAPLLYYKYAPLPGHGDIKLL